MGPYCTQYKSIVFFFYSSLPLAQSILFEEKIDDAQTQTLSPWGMS